MPNYLNVLGEVTTQDDVDRLIWYSAKCGYWTDDWDKTSKLPVPSLKDSSATCGIPCCPHCKSPGYQASAQNWFKGAEKFEQEAHPFYVQFLETLKESCSPTVKWLDRYREWIKEKNNGEKESN